MEITTILCERVDQAKQSSCIVVGIVDKTGSKTVSYGHFSYTDNNPADGDTVFEIGSATKVFTGLLLADMVKRGEVRLNDPISRYLPKSVRVPVRNSQPITLLDLATHTSGLPRLPDNFAPTNMDNPYAEYTLEQLYAFISDYTLTRDIGSEYEYSNLGAGLLGHILALKSDTDYETVLLRRICLPLGMTHTRITLSSDMKARLAPGHNTEGQPVANWDISTFAGAGALRSTANNLLKFLAANLGLTKSDLWPAVQLAQKPRRNAGSQDTDVGLCWHILKKFGTVLIWHNGGTGGYHSFIGINPQTKRGVVVLANSANSTDDIGFHLLEANYPLSRPQPVR